MDNVSIVGLDLAKTSFQAHGMAPDGSVVFRRKITRGQLLAFFERLPRCELPRVCRRRFRLGYAAAFMTSTCA